MTVKTPEQWHLNRYRRFIRLEGDGRRAITHLAEVVDSAGDLCAAYVKHYGPHTPRGLFNEWFGHTLLNALQIAQPAAAIMPAPNPVTGRVEWAFVSLVPRPKYEGSAKQMYNIRDRDQYKALVKRLFNECEQLLPGLIAADQLLINTDRNIGNLLFVSKGRFLVIDCGEILGGASSDASCLMFPQGWARSVLIEDLVPLSTLKTGLKNAIIAAGQLLIDKFYDEQSAIMAAISYPENRETYLPFEAVWWRTLELDSLFGDKFYTII